MAGERRGDRQGSETQQQKGPILPAGLLLTLAAAVVFPFDRVLAGMAAAGHGIEAICLYLGLTRTVLLEHVVRLGLATPHDRPLRKSGPRGWSVLETMCLIAWRVLGVHPETICARLGRSVNAVRAKAGAWDCRFRTAKPSGNSIPEHWKSLFPALVLPISRNRRDQTPPPPRRPPRCAVVPPDR